jgi:hypothetical protein
MGNERITVDRLADQVLTVDCQYQVPKPNSRVVIRLWHD